MGELRAFATFSLAAAFLAVCLTVRAAPPNDSDPYSPTARWFRSLYDAEGHSCCSIADCRPTEYRLTPRGYEALIDRRFGISTPTWLAVPEDKILRGKGNPTGRFVVCYAPHDGIKCAVMPDET